MLILLRRLYLKFQLTHQRSILPREEWWLSVLWPLGGTGENFFFRKAQILPWTLCFRHLKKGRIGFPYVHLGYVISTSNPQPGCYRWAMICRCNLRQEYSLLLPFSKIDVVTLLFDSSFWNRYLQSDILVLYPPWDVSDSLTLSWKNPAIFRGGSVDYSLKSILRSEWNFFGIE